MLQQSSSLAWQRKFPILRVLPKEIRRFSIAMLKYVWVASNINHYYNNCAAKNKNKSHLSHPNGVYFPKPSHVALPCAAAWQRQGQDCQAPKSRSCGFNVCNSLPFICMQVVRINMLLHSVQFKLTTLILNSFSCCLFLNTSQPHGDISRIPKDNDWISTECPGQEAFPSHQTLYTEPEVCNARD